MIIDNVKIYTEAGTFVSGGIITQGDKITEIYTEAEKENIFKKMNMETEHTAAQCSVQDYSAKNDIDNVLDGKGAYAIPGLIDLHFHGCVGDDFCDGDKEAIRRIAEYEVSVGVTAIAPATMTLPVAELENILKTAGEPVTSRNVAFLLQTPQQDGGQWDMIVSIFKKYGVVPKSVMPESFSSSASSDLNKYLNKKLRQDAKVLRDLVARGASEEEINETRKQLMQEVYDLLSVTLGTPPETFDFEYRDKDKEFHRHLNLTPQSFFEQFVGLNLDDYVSIINSPTADKPFNRSYTVEMLGNVVGNQVRYLNLDMATFKELAIRQLEQGESVWFGCDVGQSSNRGNGRLALNNFDLEGLTGIDYSLTKGERLEYGDSLMTHAMVLTGVNLVDGKPNRWKVENSWGEESGVEGFWMMSDAWMDEFTYQIVEKEQLDAFNSEPIVLAPWDPMGSLA